MESLLGPFGFCLVCGHWFIYFTHSEKASAEHPSGFALSTKHTIARGIFPSVSSFESLGRDTLINTKCQLIVTSRAGGSRKSSWNWYGGCNSENSRSWEETVRETRQEEIKRLPSKALARALKGESTALGEWRSMLLGGSFWRKRRKICSIESHFPFFSHHCRTQ